MVICRFEISQFGVSLYVSLNEKFVLCVIVISDFWADLLNGFLFPSVFDGLLIFSIIFIAIKMNAATIAIVMINFSKL